jgi:hypothetical protein
MKRPLINCARAVLLIRGRTIDVIQSHGDEKDDCPVNEKCVSLMERKYVE